MEMTETRKGEPGRVLVVCAQPTTVVSITVAVTKPTQSKVEVGSGLVDTWSCEG